MVLLGFPLQSHPQFVSAGVCRRADCYFWVGIWGMGPARLPPCTAEVPRGQICAYPHRHAYSCVGVCADAYASTRRIQRYTVTLE